MPRRRYHIGEDLQLDVRWHGTWRNVELRLNQRRLAFFGEQSQLASGADLELPDGRSLHVALADRPWGHDLRVLVDGSELRDVASAPEDKLQTVFFILLAVGVIDLLCGAIGYLTKSTMLWQMGFGQHSMYVGFTLGLLAVMVQGRSQIALGLAIALYVFDGVLSIVYAARGGNLLPYGGMFFRVVIAVLLAPGFAAIRQLGEPSEE